MQEQRFSRRDLASRYGNSIDPRLSFLKESGVLEGIKVPGFGIGKDDPRNLSTGITHQDL